MPNLKASIRQDQEAALLALQEQELRRNEACIVWLDEPEPTLWQTFEKHALGIVGGVLFISAVLYLLALVRAL